MSEYWEGWIPDCPAECCRPETITPIPEAIWDACCAALYEHAQRQWGWGGAEHEDIEQAVNVVLTTYEREMGEGRC